LGHCPRGDHNNVEAGTGAKKVIRGLDAGGEWAKVEESIGDIKIRTVGVYHDDKEGQDRGKTAVFIFETAGITIVHLGDLGHLLSPDQIKAIGKADVLLIPVGGTYTIDARAAKQVVDQLQSRLVIPMHYKIEGLTLPLDKADKFLALMPAVERKETDVLELRDLPAQTTVIVLTKKK
jgi:L-ascorbate metabolism protein UlaG (beta-lactamase superfamily)